MEGEVKGKTYKMKGKSRNFIQKETVKKTLRLIPSLIN